MNSDALQATIDAAWEDRDTVVPGTTGPVRDAIEAALDGLDSGTLRVAEKIDGAWRVNQWLKKAVLLSFRVYNSATMAGGPIAMQVNAASVPRPLIGAHSRDTRWQFTHRARGGTNSAPQSVQREPISFSS